VALPGVGMSVMEISHRSKTFDEIIRCRSGLRELLNIPKDLRCFLAGRRDFAVRDGADEFFIASTVSADYIVTGIGARRPSRKRRNSARSISPPTWPTAASRACRARTKSISTRIGREENFEASENQRQSPTSGSVFHSTPSSRFVRVCGRTQTWVEMDFVLARHAREAAVGQVGGEIDRAEFLRFLTASCPTPGDDVVRRSRRAIKNSSAPSRTASRAALQESTHSLSDVEQFAQAGFGHPE